MQRESVIQFSPWSAISMKIENYYSDDKISSKLMGNFKNWAFHWSKNMYDLARKFRSDK